MEHFRLIAAANGQGGGGAPFMPKTVSGVPYDECISGLQKMIRRGKEKEALILMQEVCSSGYPSAVARRLMIIAAEDIGLANPEVVTQVYALCTPYNSHLPESRLSCSQNGSLYCTHSEESQDMRPSHLGEELVSHGIVFSQNPSSCLELSFGLSILAVWRSKVCSDCLPRRCSSARLFWCSPPCFYEPFKSLDPIFGLWATQWCCGC